MDLFYMGAESISTICGPDGSLEDVFNLIGTAGKIILIVIPILLVIFGLMDLAKAVMAGEDKEIKAAQKMIMKRLIYTIVAFLFLGIVTGALKILAPKNADGTSEAGEVIECLNTMFN